MTLNDRLKDFPHATVVSIVGLVLSVITIINMNQLMGRGKDLPNNYEVGFFFLASMLGVGMSGFAVKRFTDYGRQAIKQGASIQDVAAAQQITATGTYPVPVAAPRAPITIAQGGTPPEEDGDADDMPQAGVRSSNPEVIRGLEAVAERQRAANTDDDPGII